MSRIYLAGPMSGIKDFNFPAFHERADSLAAQGYDVVNPATHGDVESWDFYIRKDLKLLLDCDAVAVLPGWRASKGASLEVHVARTLDMPVYDARTMDALDSESVLQEAQRLITSDRNDSYDHPSRNHSQTAALWSAYLSRKLKAPIEARDVCWMMTLLKASRDSHKPGRDNLVDGAGYLGNAEQIEQVSDPWNHRA